MPSPGFAWQPATPSKESRICACPVLVPNATNVMQHDVLHDSTTPYNSHPLPPIVLYKNSDVFAAVAVLLRRTRELVCVTIMRSVRIEIGSKTRHCRFGRKNEHSACLCRHSGDVSRTVLVRYSRVDSSVEVGGRKCNMSSLCFCNDHRDCMFVQHPPHIVSCRALPLTVGSSICCCDANIGIVLDTGIVLVRARI
jgi:hypothetical protein